MNKRRKMVSVSKLSWYAENPDEFIEYKGEAINAHSAKLGTEYHSRSLRKRSNRLWITIILLLVAAYCFVAFT